MLVPNGMLFRMVVSLDLRKRRLYAHRVAVVVVVCPGSRVQCNRAVVQAVAVVKI